jgi:hypothetical protein
VEAATTVVIVEAVTVETVTVTVTTNLDLYQHQIFWVLVLVFFGNYCNEAIHRASQTSPNIARVKKISLY